MMFGTATVRRALSATSFEILDRRQSSAICWNDADTSAGPTKRISPPGRKTPAEFSEVPGRIGEFFEMNHVYGSVAKR